MYDQGSNWEHWEMEQVRIAHEKIRRELWKDAFIAYFNYKQDSIAAIMHADKVTCAFDQRFNPTKEETKDGDSL